jgi:26S proteasome regulatory subunit N6
MTMDKQTRLEEAAEAKAKGDMVGVEQIYHEILSKDAGNNESALREQEVALIQLGELYRDQRCVRRETSCILTAIQGCQ